MPPSCSLNRTPVASVEYMIHPIKGPINHNAPVRRGVARPRAARPMTFGGEIAQGKSAILPPLSAGGLRAFSDKQHEHPRDGHIPNGVPSVPPDGHPFTQLDTPSLDDRMFKVVTTTQSEPDPVRAGLSPARSAKSEPGCPQPGPPTQGRFGVRTRQRDRLEDKPALTVRVRLIDSPDGGTVTGLAVHPKGAR